LAVPGIRDALIACKAPVVAVSPLIGGQAVKGPTAKLMGELGLVVNNDSIAQHYGDLLDVFVIDSGDDCPVPDLTIARTDTLMTTLDDKIRVARAALDLAATLA
jgi:LPPG:FO 2-phospho-L-lactate transferase